MRNCRFSEKCAFYRGTMLKIPLGWEYLKLKYCERRPEACERYRLADEVAVDDVNNEITPLGRNYAL